MTLKTYQAATMAQALAQVKQDLGRNAVILHTRTFRKGGLMGLIGGRSMWEVTASPNVNVPPRSRREASPVGAADAERDELLGVAGGEYSPDNGWAAAPHASGARAR